MMTRAPNLLRRLGRFWPLLAILAAVLLLRVTGWHELVTLERVVEHRARLRAEIAAYPWASLFAFGLVYAGVVLLALPGAALLTLAGGFLFGWSAGAAAAVLGATLGAVGLLLLARTALGDLLRRRAGPRLNRIMAGFQADAASYLLVLRLVPVFPFFIVNLAAAALNAPLGTFAWTTLVGIMPGTVAYALAGAGLDSVLAARVAAFDACLAVRTGGCTLDLRPADLLTAPLAAALVALALVALIPVALKYWRGAAILPQEPPAS